MKHLPFFLLLIAVLTACGSKRAGDSCKGTHSLCKDKSTALSCHNGTYAEVACAGPLACVKYQDHANCDTSVAKEGDNCMGEDDERACSPDKKRALICKNGKFAVDSECRGPNGCSMLGRQTSCDISVAVKGDACKTQGSTACAEDQKHMLVCRAGGPAAGGPTAGVAIGSHFDLYRYCRGQYGCATKAEAPYCDETLSLAGDPCGMPGQVVCAVDGKSELVCQGGVYTTSISCKKGCSVTNRPGRPIDCK
jgi:hypothetical protein